MGTEPFQLPAATIDELRRLLGPAAQQLTPRLQEVVRDHVSPHAKERREAWYGRASSPKGDGSIEIRRTVTALRGLIKTLETADPVLRARFGMGGTFADLGPSGNEWERLRAFREIAEKHLRYLEGCSRPWLQKRGRPKDIHRQQLAHDVAVVLRLGGVELTTSRHGKFARILESILFAIYHEAPEDMFRLIQRVVHAATEGTVDELRQNVSRAARYRTNPEFWLRLSVH
jgi:hypothetical protein